MAHEVANSSITQPELLQTWTLNSSLFKDILPDFLVGWSAWKYVMTFLLGVVVYDQGKSEYRVY